MAEKTVQEKLADKKSMIALSLADQEYQTLLDSQAINSAHRSLRVAACTRSERIASKLADRLAQAQATLALSERDVLLLSKAASVGKAPSKTGEAPNKTEQTGAVTL